MRSEIVAFLLLYAYFRIANSDEYVAEVMKRCKTSKVLLECFKYRVLRYVADAIFEESQSFFSNTTEDFLNIVAIAPNESYNTSFYVEDVRYFSQDDEITKFEKFLGRLGDSFLGTHAITITLPREMETVYEHGRSFEINLDNSRKKKAKVAIIPMLLLLKLFKIKVLVAAALLGIIVIKKIVIIAAIFFPHYLKNIKETIFRYYPHHHHDEYHEYEYDPHYDVGSSGYGKEWDRGGPKRG